MRLVFRVGAAGYLGLDTVLYQRLGVFHALPERLSTLLILFVVGIRYRFLRRFLGAMTLPVVVLPGNQTLPKSSKSPQQRCPAAVPRHVFNTRAREALACA